MKQKVSPTFVFFAIATVTLVLWWNISQDQKEKEAQRIAAQQAIEAQHKMVERERREEQRRIEREKKDAAKTPDERRREEIEKHFSPWDGSHREVTASIKKRMNDPSTYKHAETRYIENGDHLMVITSFRGANAFGGVVLNRAIAKVDMDGNVLELEIGR